MEFKFERPTNPLTSQGIQALAIVVAVIILISAIVYLNITRQSKQGSPVLPATTTREEETIEPEPTEELTPMLEEEPKATASPTATVVPTATEPAPTE